MCLEFFKCALDDKSLPKFLYQQSYIGSTALSALPIDKSTQQNVPKLLLFSIRSALGKRAQRLTD